jgi:hypothetical protein
MSAAGAAESACANEATGSDENTGAEEYAATIVSVDIGASLLVKEKAPANGLVDKPDAVAEMASLEPIDVDRTTAADGAIEAAEGAGAVEAGPDEVPNTNELACAGETVGAGDAPDPVWVTGAAKPDDADNAIGMTETMAGSAFA